MSLFQEAAREFDRALDNGDLKTAKRLLGELSSFGHDASTKFSALAHEWEKTFLTENGPALQALCKKEAFEEARTLIAKWENIGISTETHKKLVQDCEERAFHRIFDSLPMVSGLSAEASHLGPAKVVLSWSDVLHRRDGKYSIARKIGPGRFSAFSDGVKIMDTVESSIRDENVPLGVPVTYAVAACFKEKVNGKTMSLIPDVICTEPIKGFHCMEAAGNDSFGIVSLSWRNPTWDVAAKVETRLLRDDGRNWDVSGKDSFEDESVRAGESRKYSLEVTVAGKRLDPVECAVVVERVVEPPAVGEGYVFMQDGRPKLSIPNWPDGVPEVVISRSGLEPRYWSREDNDTASFYFHSLEEVDAATIQAVRRFCGKHEVRGPASRIKRQETARILFVSTGSQKKSLWSHEHGMTVCMDDGSAVPSLMVTIGKPNGRTCSFSVASGGIAPGEFFTFPADWDARCKDDVEVSVADSALCGEVIVRYRTSRTLP